MHVPCFFVFVVMGSSNSLIYFTIFMRMWHVFLGKHWQKLTSIQTITALAQALRQHGDAAHAASGPGCTAACEKFLKQRLS
jgi:hypothetical protein